MALYVLVCRDKPDSLDLRLATRSEHLAYAGRFSDRMKLAGPILDAAGDMAGSLLIFEFDSADQAWAFNRNDPYTQAGLFADVEVFPFKATLGALA
ncbi:MAG: hypothetical protein CGW95_00170 [Phenylobacterium zucineum]|nr:MAG: hypothetical protein CGW95_00170 [Phenylobacterium zucineum]